MIPGNAVEDVQVQILISLKFKSTLVLLFHKEAHN